MLLDVELLVWTYRAFITERTQYPSGHFKCDMVKVERHHVHSRDKVVAILYKAVMLAILGISFYSLCSMRWINWVCNVEMREMLEAIMNLVGRETDRNG